MAAGKNNIDADGAKAIAEALIKNQSLTQLNLSKLLFRYAFNHSLAVAGNKIGANGANAIAEALMKNQSLTRLNLGNRS